MLLLMTFFKASAWRNFYSIQLLGSSNQKVFLSKPFGNLGIDISTSALSLASTLQKKYFYLQNFKKRIFMFFLVLSWYQHHFATYTYISTISCSSIQSRLFVSRKRLFEHSETSLHWCFKETTVPKISAYFAYFLAKYPGWSSF